MDVSENKKKERKLIKSAYKLGYEVGFHKHNEFWGWVRKSKKTLFEGAKSTGFYGTVVEEFKKGKKEGQLAKRKHSKEKHIKTSPASGRSIKAVTVEEPEAEIKGEDEIFLPVARSLLTQIKYNFIEKPSHISRATLIDLPKLIRMPRFLRVYNSKK
ncbi:MAG: hypothetical protein V3R82_05220 [Candidatus Hydrothermarchaeales archaeon]